MKFYTNFSLLRNKVYVRGYDDGKQFFEQLPYEPTLFMNSNEETGFKSIDGKPVKPINFESPREAREFAKQYKGVANFEIHGFPNFEYSAISEWYPGVIEYDPSLVRVFNFDIEVDVAKNPETGAREFPEPEFAKWPINAIGLVYAGKCICFGLGEFDTSKMTAEYDLPIIFKSYTSEKDLLCSFINFWNMVNPEILTGWNIETFDIPYLVNRINNVLGEEWSKKLSPYGQVRAKTFTGRFGKDETTYTFEGLAVLDYIALYRKHTFVTRESYKLDHIAYVELGERKLEFDGNLFALYEENPQLFFEYNCKDVILVHRLDKKLGLLGLIMNLSYFTKINYDDVASPVKTWDVILANRLMETGVVVPFNTPHVTQEAYEGAYVKDPIVGRYGWLISVDKNSMYPNIIRSANIGPDTYVRPEDIPEELLKLKDTVQIGGIDQLLKQTVNTDILLKYNYGMTANGEFYRRDHEGIMSVLVGELYYGRKSDKTESLKAKALVERIHQELQERGVNEF